MSTDPIAPSAVIPAPTPEATALDLAHRAADLEESLEELQQLFVRLCDRAFEAAELFRKLADVLQNHGEAKDANDARHLAELLDAPLDGPG